MQFTRKDVHFFAILTPAYSPASFATKPFRLSSRITCIQNCSSLKKKALIADYKNHKNLCWKSEIHQLFCTVHKINTAQNCRLALHNSLQRANSRIFHNYLLYISCATSCLSIAACTRRRCIYKTFSLSLERRRSVEEEEARAREPWNRDAPLCAAAATFFLRNALLWSNTCIAIKELLLLLYAGIYVYTPVDPDDCLRDWAALGEHLELLILLSSSCRIYFVLYGRQLNGNSRFTGPRGLFGFSVLPFFLLSLCRGSMRGWSRARVFFFVQGNKF